MFFPVHGGVMSDGGGPAGRYRGSETLGYGLFSGLGAVVSGQYFCLI